jgi:membrane protein
MIWRVTRRAAIEWYEDDCLTLGAAPGTMLVHTLLFAMIFKLLPDTPIRWRHVWLGAGVTAGLFFIGKLVIGLYLATSEVGAAYGAAGWVILILAWVYYSAQIVLFGAEFTRAYALTGRPFSPPLPSGARATSPRSRLPRA